MRYSGLLILCLFADMAVAQDYSILERHVSLTWQPHEVTCTWSPVFGDPDKLGSLRNIEPVNLLERCSHGALTLTLQGEDSSGKLLRVTYKGKARVFGQAFSVCQRVSIGEEVETGNVCPTENELSNLRSAALLDTAEIIGKLAVRPLVPGKAILATDLRPQPVIQSGDLVVLICEKGGVRVSVEGIAMKEGGIGETIPVRVPEVEKNRLKGVIQNDATLRWIH